MYIHTPEYQRILQAALKQRHLKESDEDIARRGSIGCGKMTVQRFRTAKLGMEPNDKKAKGRQARVLKLDYHVANRLWKYCRDEISDLVRNGADFQKHTERLAANAINAFYRASESEMIKWRDAGGLQTQYFCYKPSFRRPGNVVKSRFKIDLAEGEYFEVREYQDAKSDSGLRSSESSEGFGFSKSERIWIFMRETSREQPRVFCFHKWDTAPDNSISKLFGYVLESDMRFAGGVFNFKVGLVSKQSDEALWAQLNPGEDYNEEEQVDNVPYPKTALAVRQGRRVVFDPDVLKYIKPKDGIDPDALD